MTPEALFEAASRCYLRAGCGDEAAACFEAIGRWLEAARCHEQAGRWLVAGQCYEHGENPSSAAHCFLRAKQYDSAAQNLARAGRRLEAAWLYAHELQQPLLALKLIDQLEARARESEPTAVEIVLARCELALAQRERAAKLLARALASADAQSPTSFARPEVHDWAIALAELLARPDLAIRAHARWRGHSLVDPDWEAWKARVFGVAEDSTNSAQAPAAHSQTLEANGSADG